LGLTALKSCFLMLTYMSTLRSKTGFFLVRPKNAYFANSLNTSHRLRFASASIRKAAPRPAFDGERNSWCVCYRLILFKRGFALPRARKIKVLQEREEKCSEDRNGKDDFLAAVD